MPTDPAPVIAVLNMKGGVGKTTVAGNVFREVYRKSKSKVLVVDFDPQYNLTQLLLNESQYELLRDDGRTLWHALTPESPTSIFDIADEDLSKPKEIDSYIHTLKRLTGDPRGPRIDILPGDFRMMQMNIRGDVASQRTSRLRWDKLVADARSAYDYVVLDCNPASSFMTTTAIQTATHLLVPVRPDKFSILGLALVSDYAHSIPGLRKQPEVLVLLNGVGRGSPPSEVERELRSHAEYGRRTLVSRMPQSNLLAARADATGFAVDQGRPYSLELGRTLRTIADELIQMIETF